MKKLKNKIDLVQEDRKFLYVNAREEKAKSLQLQKKVEELESKVDS